MQIPYKGQVNCCIDGSVHDSVEFLFEHLKKLKISRENYYHAHYPKKDPVTDELIPFKSLTQYINQDFADKNTMKKWLTQNPEKGLEWSKGWLAKRKTEKNLVYAPSQVELRTCQCPSMPYYESVGKGEGGYYGITNSLGFQPRYNLSKLSFIPFDKNTKIIQDTREQNPINFIQHTEVATVEVGDYKLSDNRDVGIRIERKSLNDFCGTLNGRKIERKSGSDSALDRFDRGLERAKERGLYVIMMVENNVHQAQSFNYLPHTRYVRASPDYIFKNLRDLLVKYPLNFQCLFVDGRVEMGRKIPRIFELGEQVKVTDLQYAYEIKAL